MPIQSSTHFLGILGVLAASLLWGTTGTAAAFAPEVSAAAIAAAAMGGGGLLQALRGLPLIRRNRALLKRHSALLLSAGLSVALYPIAFYGSMRLAGVTLGTVISIGALLLLPVLLATGSPFLHSVQNAAVGLYMAVVPMFIGYICFGYGLERVRASTAIAISLLEPVVAALLAAAVLGERLSLPAYAGIALIFASLALFTFTGKKSG